MEIRDAKLIAYVTSIVNKLFENPLSLFSEQIVVQRTPIFEIVPTKGSSGIRDKDGLFITIPEDYIVTISCQTISGNPGTVSAVMRIREEW